MGEADYVERVRRINAALTEVGHPPGMVTFDPRSGLCRISLGVPERDSWKASQVSLIPGPFGWICWQCSGIGCVADDIVVVAAERCEAGAPFTEDCGVER